METVNTTNLNESTYANKTNSTVRSAVLQYDHIGSFVFFILALAAVIYAVIIKAILIIHRNTPLVRASNLNMCLVQLFSHILFFASLLLLFGEVNEISCTVRPVVIGIMFTFIAAITLTKTQKLVFIFQARIRVSRKQVHMSKTMEAFLIFLMMCVQSCIAALSFVFNQDRRVTREQSSVKGEEIMTCNTDEEFVIQLLFAFLLILMCLMQAFKARNLPENFNETKFIASAMLVCVILCALFLPLRFHLSINEEKLFCDVYMLFSINLAMLLIMYSPKCYVILFRPDQNTQAAFKQNLRAHALQGVTKSMNRCVSMKQRMSVDSTTDAIRTSTLRVNVPL